MLVFAQLVVREHVFFLRINNISQYQKLNFKDNTEFSYNYAKYDYLFKAVEYLYNNIPQVKLINCELDCKPNLDNLIEKELIINHLMSVSMFIPLEILHEFSYRLNLDQYVTLEKPANIPDTINNEDNVVQANALIPFNLICGEVFLNNSEINALKNGDIVLFDRLDTDFYSSIKLGNYIYKFKVVNKQLILQNSYIA